MTKVTVIGKENEDAIKVLKPIELCRFLTGDTLQISVPCDENPNEYGYIELICLSYDHKCHFDLMFAYNSNDDRRSGVLFLGHFNDGVAF